jgi:RNA polymerase sigma-70 factor (ECF subfamily)
MVRQSESRTASDTIRLERVGAPVETLETRLVRLFSPLISHWCRESGLSTEKIAGICREILEASNLSGESLDGGLQPLLERLRASTRSRILESTSQDSVHTEVCESDEDRIVRPVLMETIEDPDLQEEEDLAVLTRSALDLILEEFDATSREAFLRVMIDDEEPQRTARRLGTDTASVLLVKSMVLRRFREEFAGLLGL